MQIYEMKVRNLKKYEDTNETTLRFSSKEKLAVYVDTAIRSFMQKAHRVNYTMSFRNPYLSFMEDDGEFFFFRAEEISFGNLDTMLKYMDFRNICNVDLHCGDEGLLIDVLQYDVI